jgi:NADH-quinone oxidoreductase subunit K
MIVVLFLNTLSLVILIVGFWGLVVVKGNLLLILMSVEVIIFAFSMQLLTIAAKIDDISGQIFSLFLLTVAAAESAIGLAILVVYYKLRGNLKHIFFSTLKA